MLVMVAHNGAHGATPEGGNAPCQAHGQVKEKQGGHEEERGQHPQQVAPAPTPARRLAADLDVLQHPPEGALEGRGAQLLRDGRARAVLALVDGECADEERVAGLGRALQRPDKLLGVLAPRVRDHDRHFQGPALVPEERVAHACAPGLRLDEVLDQGVDGVSALPRGVLAALLQKLPALCQGDAPMLWPDTLINASLAHHLRLCSRHEERQSLPR
mmetsp:Transcript_106817/g.331866  ORF Transcript_106817/g.331866 Transcript_106817/m.331866 type:complete len:216 (+) Transcript_106817:1197-1844(+)